MSELAPLTSEQGVHGAVEERGDTVGDGINQHQVALQARQLAGLLGHGDFKACESTRRRERSRAALSGPCPCRKEAWRHTPAAAAASASGALLQAGNRLPILKMHVRCSLVPPHTPCTTHKLGLQAARAGESVRAANRPIHPSLACRLAIRPTRRQWGQVEESYLGLLRSSERRGGQSHQRQE